MSDENKQLQIEIDEATIEAFSKHVMAFEVDNSDGYGVFRTIVLLQGLAQWIASEMGIKLPEAIEIEDRMIQ
jgi:hypothetical protein